MVARQGGLDASRDQFLRGDTLGERAQGFGALAADLTGIPALMNSVQAFGQGDWQSGAIEGALGALGAADVGAVAAAPIARGLGGMARSAAPMRNVTPRAPAPSISGQGYDPVRSFIAGQVEIGAPSPYITPRAAELSPVDLQVVRLSQIGLPIEDVARRVFGFGVEPRAAEAHINRALRPVEMRAAEASPLPPSEPRPSVPSNSAGRISVLTDEGREGLSVYSVAGPRGTTFDVVILPDGHVSFMRAGSDDGAARFGDMSTEETQDIYRMVQEAVRLDAQRNMRADYYFGGADRQRARINASLASRAERRGELPEGYSVTRMPGETHVSLPGVFQPDGPDYLSPRGIPPAPLDLSEPARMQRASAPTTQPDFFPETAPGPLRAYHGTRGEISGDFAPFSHFGTEQAARDRVRATYGELLRPNAHAPERILPVEIHGRRVDVGDERDLPQTQFSTGVSEVAEALRRKRLITEDELRHVMEPSAGGQHRYLGRDSEDVMRERLADIAARNDIGAIGYRNAVEDPGSRSYIVPDPANARPFATQTQGPPQRGPSDSGRRVRPPIKKPRGRNGA